MSDRRFRSSLALSLATLTALAAVPDPVEAQDFLLSTPTVTLGIFAGLHSPRADSELFDRTISEFTVDSEDFNTAVVRGEVSIRITPRVDFAFDVSRTKADITSEYRDFVGADDLPIVQTTTLSQTPISLNLKYYLRDRGRTIGNLAWVPERFSAYVGAGAGFVLYDLVQQGEFIQSDSLTIVRQIYDSSSRGQLIQLLAGAEFSVSPRAMIVADGRYRLASADLLADFTTIRGITDDLDLSGLSLSLGLAVRL